MFPQTSIAALSVASHAMGAVAFAGLALVLMLLNKSSRVMRLLQLACAVNAVWLAALVVLPTLTTLDAAGLGLVETLRAGAWLLLAYCLIPAVPAPRTRRIVAGVTVALPMALATLLTLMLFDVPEPRIAALLQTAILPFSAVLMVLWGLILAEQVLRGSDVESRWALKYAAIGLGVLFGYDFVMYSGAILYGHVDAGIWAARGIVNALAVPLFAVSAARHETWERRFQPSRQALFYTGTLGLGGGYLLFVGVGGYTIRLVGTSWAELSATVFVSTALVGALVLLLSGQVRAYALVFVNKHFFRHKYDYRTEWLALTHGLSQSADSDEPYQRAIRAVAHILDSPAGALWHRREGEYVCVSHWNLSQTAETTIGADADLVRFFRETSWIVDLDEYQRAPERYDQLQLPGLFAALPRRRLLVPLYSQDELLGIMLLTAPRAHYHLTWEDFDLLKTVGHQVGVFLDQQESTQALAQARQFEGFNRLTTYLMHDLKNIANQQWLMLQNAPEHKHKSAFVDDMIATIGDSVERMQKLLDQLRGTSASATETRRIPLDTTLEGIVTALRDNAPVPSFENGCPDVFVHADPAAFASVIKHLIRNAQEATPVDGHVVVTSSHRDETVHITITDTGTGMTPAFIRDSLFKPFVTTKTAQGLGIGAHQARDFAHAAGGELTVTSQAGEGSSFTLQLPLADMAKQAHATPEPRLEAGQA